MKTEIIWKNFIKVGAVTLFVAIVWAVIAISLHLPVIVTFIGGIFIGYTVTGIGTLFWPVYRSRF